MTSMAAIASSSYVVLILTLCIILSYITIGGIVNYRKLSQFKGPPLAGFSRFWLFWQVYRRRLWLVECAAHEKYGPVCRIGPDLLITNDPDILRHVNSRGSKWTRAAFYEAMKLDPRLDSVFSTRDERLHEELKHKEMGAYNGRDVELEPDIDARVAELMNLIKTAYDGIVLDMSAIARFFTLDVLSTIAFGRPFGFMAANSDLWDYHKVNASFTTMAVHNTHHKFVRWLLSTLLMQALAAPKMTDKRGMGPALNFARKAVAERYGPNPKKRKDMLGHFVEMGFSQTQCEVESNLQILAGSDSTTTVLRSTMYLLAGNPVSYGKLQAEVDQAALTGAASHPVITYAEAQKLPYLNAVIWEGLRMYPPLFGLKSKLAPPGGESIKDIFFPEGCELGNCDYAYVRRKDIFGEDANLFRPERWLEANPQTKIQYRQTVDTIFGTGRYICLGRHIAWMEMSKAIFELVRNFDWMIADPLRGIDGYSHVVHLHWNMNMVARSRS